MEEEMPGSADPVLEELVQHEGFVRNALRGLLADEARIQDLLQETWLRVLQGPPRRLREPRTWLARVARNLAVSAWREESRRKRREAEAAANAASADAARADVLGATGEAQERLETRQCVVHAILSLDEPYRTVVVLRYENGLAPGEIARRLGRPAGTVRSQLARAHELLRARLDRELGDRRRWAVLAAPFPRATSWSLAGTAAAAGLAAAALGTLWWVWSSPGRPDVPRVEVARGVAPVPSSTARAPAPAPDADGQETSLEIRSASTRDALPEGERIPGASAASSGFGAENERTSVDPGPQTRSTPRPVLREPRIVLQVRAGAVGGNPSRIDMCGRTSTYVDRVAERELDFSTPLDTADESVAYFEGGPLPPDKALIVTRVTYWGTARGDSNGHGELTLVVGGERLVEEEDTEEAIEGGWTGRIRVVPGEETRTYLEIANSSAANVLIEGFFEDLQPVPRRDASPARRGSLPPSRARPAPAPPGRVPTR